MKGITPTVKRIKPDRCRENRKKPTGATNTCLCRHIPNHIYPQTCGTGGQFPVEVILFGLFGCLGDD